MPILTSSLRPPLLLAFSALLLSACTNSGGFGTRSTPALTEVARSRDVQWTGVAASEEGRIFVNSPNWHDGHTWSVAELQQDGSLKNFPNDTWNGPDWATSPANRFVCVQAVYVDKLDRLWVVDPGSPKLAGVIPGAPKLVQIDLKTNQVTDTFFFDDAIAPKQSYLNDVRIDTDRGFAYLTDSGLGAIIVLDLNTRQARRLLANDERTKAEPIVPLIGGRELRFSGGPNKGEVPKIHSDGIALSTDGEYLYWQALIGRTLYRIPTAVLRDPEFPETRLGVKVQNMGQTVMTDGMEIDADGILYFTALEKDAIIIRRPDRGLETLVQDPRFIWPDSFAFGPRNRLYFTTAQINKTSWFSPDGSMPSTPYLLFRTGKAR